MKQTSNIQSPTFLQDFGKKHKLSINVFTAVDGCDNQVPYHWKNIVSETIVKSFESDYKTQSSIDWIPKQYIPEVNFFNYRSHWCYVNQKSKTIIQGYSKCKNCFHWISTRNFTRSLAHFQKCVACEKCGKAMMLDGKHISRCSGVKAKKIVKESVNDDPEFVKTELIEKLSPDKFATYKQGQMFCDLETFMDGSNGHCVYAAGYCYSDHSAPPGIFIGKDSLQKLVDQCLNFDGTVWFYNGSGFDMFFVLKDIIKRHETKYMSMVKANNRIFSLTWRKKPKSKKITNFRDLWLFSYGSLRNACKSFGVDERFWKKDFDHSLIRCWEDVSKHREAIHLYLSYDCISLKEVYLSMAKELYETHRLNIHNYMTKSAFAYDAWRTQLDGIEIYNIPVEDNKRLRNAYYGGRTTPQYGLYEAKGDDCLKYVDISSLYPAVMHKHRYPIGQPRHIQFGVGKIRSDLIRYPDNERWKRMIFVVDVLPPNYILTPFLFSKDKDGKLEKNLKPKKHQYYCGTELIHAVKKLGYRITKIYSCWEWPSSEYIFKTYVSKEYELKNEAERGSAAYMVHKLLLNSLSGKFGQKDIEETLRFYSGDDISKLNINRLIKWQPYYNDDGELDIIEATLEKKRDFSKYPLYLSAFILANSRVHMSNVLLDVDGYRNKKHAFYYTDTDSLHVNRDTFDLLKQKGWMKEELGYLGDELDGGEIIGAQFHAPKTYCHRFVKDNQVLIQVKCKGIPHPHDYYDGHRRFYAEDEDVELVQKFFSKSYDLSRKYITFSKPLFLYKPSPQTAIQLDKQWMVLTRLDWHCMKDKLLNPDAVIETLYGTMKRNFSPSHSFIGPYLTVHSMWNSRSLGKTDWWAGKNRVLINNLYRDFGLTNFAYPSGHRVENPIEKLNEYIEQLVDAFPLDILNHIRAIGNQYDYQRKHNTYFKNVYDAVFSYDFYVGKTVGDNYEVDIGGWRMVKKLIVSFPKKWLSELAEKRAEFEDDRSVSFYFHYSKIFYR